jgi:hypothetical protein
MPDMPARRPIITLLTDFGERDDYVGAMKGVILSIAPEAQLVDISHQIEPQNIREAATILDSVYRFYPSHTVHMVVVDPGVGSARLPIALRTAYGIFVAPDNGVLTPVYSKDPDDSVLVALENTEYWLPDRTNTFHGRDVFSPVAAHLANGVPLEKMGPRITGPIMLIVPELEITPTLIRGEVTRIDHFGNALTNIIPLRWLDSASVELAPIGKQPILLDAVRCRVTCGWHSVSGLHQNYSTVSIGQPVAVIGSSQELEIAINQGNASEKFDIKVGSPVTLQFG